MKQILLSILCIHLLSLLPVYAEAVAEDSPEALHTLAMENLQKQSDIWREIADKRQRRKERALYLRVADSYLELKAVREETFLAARNKQSVHYEKLIQTEERHARLLEEAEAVYGPNAPKLPAEKKAPPPPQERITPTPTPPAKYRSESGFEVILKLEE
ncbi:MAG: hypothetical protein ACO3N7_00825 [Kiritimatiellia bacterium]